MSRCAIHNLDRTKVMHKSITLITLYGFVNCENDDIFYRKENLQLIPQPVHINSHICTHCLQWDSNPQPLGWWAPHISLGQGPFCLVGTIVYEINICFYLQPGTFDLVGTIVYEIDQVPYQNTFYNGTIEVSEAGGFVSVETVFLVSLGLALLVLLGLWVRTQLQLLSKVKIANSFAKP